MDYVTPIRGTSLLACKECRYAILPSSINYHFRRSPHQLSSGIRAEIFRESSKYASLIRDIIALESLSIPTSISYFYPELTLYTDGLACQECFYIVRNIKVIQKHYIDTHQWINPRGRGGNTRVSTIETPWKSDIPCQRFFHSPPGHSYFRVNPNRPYSSRETSPNRVRSIRNEEDNEIRSIRSERSSSSTRIIQGISSKKSIYRVY